MSEDVPEPELSDDGLRNRYAERLKRLLKHIGEAIRDATDLVVSDPWEMDDDSDDVWVVSCHHSKEGIDVEIRLARSETWDGSPDGANFTIQATSDDGTEVGRLTPFNYTSSCWVPRADLPALDRRLALVEATDYGELVHLIEEHLKTA